MSRTFGTGANKGRIEIMDFVFVCFPFIHTNVLKVYTSSEIKKKKNNESIAKYYVLKSINDFIINRKKKKYSEYGNSYKHYIYI